MMSDVRAELGGRLLQVEKPGRYVGGEYGAVSKPGEALLRVAVSYPDLYEIGMSNHSVRLLYRLLNAREDVACERVFAPAPDFEVLLRNSGLPIYTLESGRPLGESDLIGFSLGYELCMTNMLAILDLAGVPLRSADRGPHDPIVLAGGPAVTNPLPYAPFVDGVLIGEAEEWLDTVFGGLARLKAGGAGRRELLELLRNDGAVWHAGKSGPVRRAFHGGFGAPGSTAAVSSPARSPEDLIASGGTPAGLPTSGGPPAGPAYHLSGFPVPNIKTVQDHGAVEIMRGCPHGCRFCHASIFYRPFRLKSAGQVAAETDALVFGCGYREITLSSLSSGDYPEIGQLVRSLNRRYADHHVSFSLPSLRVNSLTLDLLSEISSVRKSGLTFALETPLPEWQLGLNKLASEEKTIAILKEAAKRGWRVAKFYFMVGLPVSQGQDETGPIIELLRRIKDETGMSLNVNISCFIPKPHTAYQWAPQLTEQQGLDKIMTIKRALSGRGGVKVRYHSPFQSVLEGLVSRGDERAGELVYRAYRAGARLDAWEDMVQWDLWRRVFAEAGYDVEADICRERNIQEELPWDQVRLGATKSFLRREYERSLAGELTGVCASDCGHACGACAACGPGAAPRDSIPPPDAGALSRGPAPTPGRRARLIFAFGKLGPAVFWGHLNVMQIFERALLRAGYRAQFTEGFNPKPKIDFAHPLSVGIASEGEIAGLEVLNFDSEESFCLRLSAALPEGLEVSRVRELPPYELGRKKYSLMALYWGADFLIREAPGAAGSAATTAAAGADIPDTSGGLASLSAALAAAQADAAPEARLGVHCFELNEEGLFVRYRQSEKGAGNIFRLLERLGVEEPARYSVRRLAVWAKDPRRPDSAEPADYFTLDI